MKLTPKQIEHMSSAIDGVDSPALRKRYQALRLSITQYRWDCVWKAGLSPYVQELYKQGIDDSHIDTALKKIIPDY